MAKSTFVVMCLFGCLCACADVPRFPDGYPDVIKELSTRINCELAVSYENARSQKVNGVDGPRPAWFDQLAVAYTLSIDLERDYGFGLSPLTYIAPTFDKLTYGLSPSLGNKAHRIVSVDYEVVPAELSAKRKTACPEASTEFLKLYPGDFRTDEWLNQLASYPERPKTLGYTVDFTTTYGISGSISREKPRYQVTGGGSFTRTTKNTVSFAFTFDDAKKNGATTVSPQAQQNLQNTLQTLERRITNYDR